MKKAVYVSMQNIDDIKAAIELDKLERTAGDGYFLIIHEGNLASSECTAELIIAGYSPFVFSGCGHNAVIAWRKK